MFKIPAVPSASYLAEGDVITSTRSIASAGNWLKTLLSPNPASADGLPLIKILTFSFPLRLIPPSISTETEGTLFKASLTVPPAVVKSLPML